MEGRGKKRKGERKDEGGGQEERRNSQSLPLHLFGQNGVTLSFLAVNEAGKQIIWLLPSVAKE